MAKKLKRVTLPTQVRITPKITYEVVFIDSFQDEKVVGEMRPDTKQIVIKNGLSNSELLKTFLHEVAHAISDENNIGLTESQVCMLENAVYRFLRLNNYL